MRLPVTALLLALPLAGSDLAPQGQAMTTMQSRALAGDAGAQFEMGNCAYFGRGVPRNVANAAKWFRQAAEQGHASAQMNLGNAYFRGEGLPKDPIEAYAWYSLSAANGQPAAPMNRDKAAGRLSPSALRQAQIRVRNLRDAIQERMRNR